MASVRTKRLRWSMFWAIVLYFVTIAGTQLTNYLTALDVTPLQATLISTGVGLAVVMIGVLVDHVREGGAEPAPRPGSTGRTSLAGAIVLILLFCGGGGLAAAYGANWAVGKVVEAFRDFSGESKTDPGVERLASEASARNGVLTVSVTSVQVNDRATVITLTAKNTGAESLTLPASFSQLTVPGSSTLKADPLNGTWREGAVPAGGELTGTLVFDGQLPVGKRSVTLAVTQIFGMGFNGPDNIAVEITLLP